MALGFCNTIQGIWDLCSVHSTSPWLHRCFPFLFSVLKVGHFSSIRAYPALTFIIKVIFLTIIIVTKMLLLSGWDTTVEIFSSGFLLTLAPMMVSYSWMEIWYFWRFGTALETPLDGNFWFCSLSCFWGLVFSWREYPLHMSCAWGFKVLEIIHLKEQEGKEKEGKYLGQPSRVSNIRDNGCVYHFVLLWTTARLNNLRGERFYVGYCWEVPVHGWLAPFLLGLFKADIVWQRPQWREATRRHPGAGRETGGGQG